MEKFVIMYDLFFLRSLIYKKLQKTKLSEKLKKKKTLGKKKKNTKFY